MAILQEQDRLYIHAHSSTSSGCGYAIYTVKIMSYHGISVDIMPL